MFVSKSPVMNGIKSTIANRVRSGKLSDANSSAKE